MHRTDGEEEGTLFTGVERSQTPGRKTSERDVAGGDRSNRSKRSNPDWFWHPFTLAFDGALEKTYYDSCMVDVIGRDCAVYVLSCIPLPMMLMMMWSSERISLFQVVISSILTIVPPTLAFLSCYREKWYWKRRDMIVSAVQIALGIFMIHWSLKPFESVGKGDPSAVDLAMHILTKSPIAANLFCAVCLKLRFRNQCAVELVMLIMSCTWTVLFCSSCSQSSVNPHESGLFNSLWGIIDGMHPITVLMKLPESNSSSCLGVSMFLMMVMGCLVPLAFVYYREILWREKFLEPRVEKSEKISLSQFRKKGVDFLMWVLLTVVQVSWIIFRGFG